MGPQTKSKILDAAEVQFAQHGFQAASLRGITQAAGVNLAAIHYHYHSKDGLIRAVLERCAGPINQERLERLARCEETAAPHPPELEEIVDALVWPALRMNSDPERGAILTQLMGKLHSEVEGPLADILAGIFGEVAQRFRAALVRAVPHLSRSDIAWRFVFTLGSMAFTMTHRRQIERLSGESTPSVEAARAQLVTFLAAGLRAPSASGATPK